MSLSNRRDQSCVLIVNGGSSSLKFALFEWNSSGEVKLERVAAGRIERVALLGHGGALAWKHDERGLVVQLPPQKPCEHAYALKIEGLATA